MPYLELLVNVPVHDETELALEFSKVAARALSKPESYITVSITFNKTLTFGGTLEPAFALRVVSLDNLSPSLNEGYSKILSEFITSKFGIPNDRGYINFDDPGRGYLGFKGTTFDTIFAK
ncbi:Tautomerase/MIF superfamily [Mycena belliarum]|uniref:L-dopachrome isomerase n=1 Tax=Mycena belliarum TaxID=1033014 RepID=A0AAD6XPV3_9AGAR|nr:Tautomerase/MIF superfamily [Mycena belliae]